MLYAYSTCRDDIPHKLLGTTPCRELLFSSNTPRLYSPPKLVGIVPDTELPLTSRYVSDVKRPNDVGKVPIKYDIAILISVMCPVLLQLTPTQCDRELEHTLVANGTVPVHVQLEYPAVELALSAAARLHMIASSDKLVLGTAEGARAGLEVGTNEGSFPVTGFMEGVLDGVVFGVDVVGATDGLSEGLDVQNPMVPGLNDSTDDKHAE